MDKFRDRAKWHMGLAKADEAAGRKRSLSGAEVRNYASMIRARQKKALAQEEEQKAGRVQEEPEEKMYRGQLEEWERRGAAGGKPYLRHWVSWDEHELGVDQV